MMSQEKIIARFRNSFPATREWRTVGRESEHPIVHLDGHPFDVAALWAPLQETGTYCVLREGPLIIGLEADGLIFSSEVGRGTMEIIVGPCDDLVTLAARFEDGMRRLLRAAEACDALVLGYGIQPAASPDLALMTPKQRYGVLRERIGEGWLWFALTASDQVHSAIARDEAIPLSNIGNLMTPLTVALCAHSPIFAGTPSGVCCAREACMGEILSPGSQSGHGPSEGMNLKASLPGKIRHGMTPRAYADFRDLIEGLNGLDFIIRKVDGLALVQQGTFAEYLAEHLELNPEALWTDFLVHDHYIWHSARLRTAHGTLEMRSACQQPPHEHMAATALGVAIVAAGPALARYLDERLGADIWPDMRTWHGTAIKDGLEAEEPAPGLCAGLLERCEDALKARGRGEARYLAPLWKRLEARQNPAQTALAVFEQRGLAGLIEHVRWKEA